MPLLRLGSSPLGGGTIPQHPLTVSVPAFPYGAARLGTHVTKLRGTIQLGRYVFGGGGFAPPDPRNAYFFWSTGTTVAILPAVNGIAEQFTSMLADDFPLAKIGINFTLGHGGVVTYLGQTGDLTMDGTHDLAITATSYTNLVGTGWFQFNLAPLLTGTSPSASVGKIDYRVPAYEYANGTNRFSDPGLYHSPYNGRHIAYLRNQTVINIFRNYNIMPQWTWKVPVVAQYARINVLNTVTSQTALSAFSNTLTGTTPAGTVTFRQSGMSQSLFAYRVRPAIYLISGSILAADMNMDGTSSVAINGTQVAQSGIIMDGTFSWTLNAIKSYAADLTMDGATNVAISADKISYGPWNADGTTDVEITTYGVFDISMLFEAAATMDISADRIGFGPWNGDGATDCQISVYQIQAGNLTMDGVTDVSIDARQIYADNTFTMDGRTNVAITAYQAYALNLTMDGTCNVVVANTVSILSGTFTCDGTASQTLDTVADFFVEIRADGATNLTQTYAFYPIIQIVITPVGDMFVLGEIAAKAGFNADGATNVAVTARLNAVGEMNLITGIRTDVTVGASKIVYASMNMDGVANVYFQVAQDQFGEGTISQVDQTLTALGTFILDGAATITSSSTVTAPNSRLYPSAPDYIWGVIEDGVDEFTQISSQSFTASGKSAVSGSGPSALGYFKHKNAYGFTRTMLQYYPHKQRDNTRYELVRIDLNVANAIDFTQILDTVGFTASGISAIGGNGIVGRDIEARAIFSAVTNVVLTQTNYEAISDGNARVAMTQCVFEMLWIPDPVANMTQLAAEILYLANLAAVNQTAVEALAGSSSDQRHAITQQVAVEMLHPIKARSMITQVAIEGAQQSNPDPPVNVTEVTLEILTYAQQFFNATAIDQQVAVEGLATGNPKVAINHTAVEILNTGDPKARVQQVAVETVHNNENKVRVQQVAVEEVNNSTTTGGATHQIAIEMLVRPEYDPTVAGLVNNPKFHT